METGKQWEEGHWLYNKHLIEEKLTRDLVYMYQDLTSLDESSSIGHNADEHYAYLELQDTFNAESDEDNEYDACEEVWILDQNYSE